MTTVKALSACDSARRLGEREVDAQAVVAARVDEGGRDPHRGARPPAAPRRCRRRPGARPPVPARSRRRDRARRRCAVMRTRARTGPRSSTRTATGVGRVDEGVLPGWRVVVRVAEVAAVDQPAVAGACRPARRCRRSGRPRRGPARWRSTIDAVGLGHLDRVGQRAPPRRRSSRSRAPRPERAAIRRVDGWSMATRTTASGRAPSRV